MNFACPLKDSISFTLIKSHTRRDPCETSCVEFVIDLGLPNFTRVVNQGTFIESGLQVWIFFHFSLSTVWHSALVVQSCSLINQMIRRRIFWYSKIFFRYDVML